MSGDDFAYHAQHTSDGGYIVAGYTKSYGEDAWIFKLQDDSKMSWQKKYHGINAVHSIQQTSDGGYVLVDSYFTVMKLDEAGNISWLKSYNSYMEVGASVRQTTDGGYVAAGIQLNNILVVRFDKDGVPTWQKTYGVQASVGTICIQQISDGGYILAGTKVRPGGVQAGYIDIWATKLDESGESVWQKTYVGENSTFANSIQQTTDGGYILTGNLDSNPQGAIVLKLQANGDISWQKEYSTGGAGESIQQTSDGYMLVTTNFVVLKLDQDGKTSWQKMYVGPDGSSAHSIQQTTDGGYVLAGSWGSFGFEPYDAWILKIDPEGNVPNSDFIKNVSVRLRNTNIVPQGTNISPVDSQAAAQYRDVSSQNLGWQNAPGLLAQLTAGDFNGDGKDDLAGVDSYGHIIYTLNVSDWMMLPGVLSQLTAGDFNADGKDDLAGVTPQGAIFYTVDLANWQWLPGNLSQITTGDLNGDGKDDLVGLTSAEQIYYTPDLNTWHRVEGLSKQLSVGDLNADQRDELVGVAASEQIYYMQDLNSWQWVPGRLGQTTIGKLNRTTCYGHLCSTVLVDQLIGLTTSGQIFWNKSQMDSPEWINPGKLAQLIACDLDGDGKADLAGLDSEGHVYYSIGF